MTSGAEVIMAALPSPLPPPDPLAPGPFAFADPDRVAAILAAAGWVDVRIEPFDAMCRFDVDGGDGVDERVTLLLGSFTGAALREQVEANAQPELLDRIRAHLSSLRTDGVLQLPGAIWLVSARSGR